MKAIMTLLLLLLSVCAYGQNTTRPGLKLNDNIRVVRSTNDTIVPAKGDIRLCGFEKSQASTQETFFVINDTDDNIKAISLDITYLNLKGEQLHKRTVTLKCDIPPSETRMLSIKSWDRQHLWYYRLTQGSHNEHCTPFDVKMSIKYVVVDH